MPVELELVTIIEEGHKDRGRLKVIDVASPRVVGLLIPSAPWSGAPPVDLYNPALEILGTSRDAGPEAVLVKLVDGLRLLARDGAHAALVATDGRSVVLLRAGAMRVYAFGPDPLNPQCTLGQIMAYENTLRAKYILEGRCIPQDATRIAANVITGGLTDRMPPPDDHLRTIDLDTVSMLALVDEPAVEVSAASLVPAAELHSLRDVAHALFDESTDKECITRGVAAVRIQRS